MQKFTKDTNKKRKSSIPAKQQSSNISQIKRLLKAFTKFRNKSIPKRQSYKKNKQKPCDTAFQGIPMLNKAINSSGWSDNPKIILFSDQISFIRNSSTFFRSKLILRGTKRSLQTTILNFQIFHASPQQVIFCNQLILLSQQSKISITRSIVFLSQAMWGLLKL